MNPSDTNVVEQRNTLLVVGPAEGDDRLPRLIDAVGVAAANERAATENLSRATDEYHQAQKQAAVADGELLRAREALLHYVEGRGDGR